MTTANQLQDTLDFIENPESRIACVMVLDVSSSMNGDPIKEVNAGLKAFINQIQSNDLTAKRADVAIIAFNHDHEVVQSFGEALDIGTVSLHAFGQTRMAPPINTALEIIENRKRQYQDAGIPYYRPIIMLLTDGYPQHDSPPDLAAVSQRIKEAEEQKKVKFFTIGTESADMKFLTTLSSQPPKRLHQTNFVQLFEWLSNSITAISNSRLGDEVELPPTDGWSRY